jgi:DNA-binding XRE family transcriptional regulator
MEAHKNEGTKLEKPDEERARSEKIEHDKEGATARVGGGQIEKHEKRANAKSSKVRNNVRKLRMERMMSKAELARRAGLSTLTVDRVERGMSCRMDTKRKILEALGLKPQDRVMVFGDAGDD